MNIINRFTLRTLLKNKVRTFVTILGIILATSMFVAITSIITSLQKYMVDIVIDQTGEWQGQIYSIDKNGIKVCGDNENISESSFVEIYENQGKLKNIAFAGIDDKFGAMVPVKMKKGNMPKDNSQIMVSTMAKRAYFDKNRLGDKIELKVGGQNKEFELVGVCEQVSSDGDLSQDMQIFTKSGLTAPDSYTMYFKCRDVSKVQETLDDIIIKVAKAEKLNKDDIAGNIHTALLKFYGVSSNSSYNTVLYGMAVILIIIIMIASISLIHNAFSISISERTKQFGLLKSAGATKRQILRSVFFEAGVLCIIGIPLGIICGLIGIGITLNLLGKQFALLLTFRTTGSALTMHISVAGVLVAVLVTVVTVLISALIPALKAVRLTVLKSLKQNESTGLKRRNVKVNPVLNKFFGFEGTLADKNFKRNKKKQRVTVFSIAVSTALFISVNSFTSYMSTSLELYNDNSSADLTMEVNREVVKKDFKTVDNALREFKGVDNIDDGSYGLYDQLLVEINIRDIDSKYFSELKKSYPEMVDEKKGIIRTDAKVYYIKDKVFEDYIRKNNLKNVNALAWHHLSMYNEDEKKNYSYDVLKKDTDIKIYWAKEKKGYDSNGLDSYSKPSQSYIKITDDDDENAEQKVYSGKDAFKTQNVKVVRCDNELPFGVKGQEWMLTIVRPYSENKNVPANVVRDNYFNFEFKAKKHVEAKENLSMFMTKRLGDQSSYISDRTQDKETSNAMVLIINVFSYGFIILISLIVIANVFNTISTNILLRRQEFAMLKSVGMTKKGLSKMMNYECVFYGIKGLIFGMAAAVLLTYAMYHVMSDGFNVGFYIPVQSIIVVIISIFVVVFASMLYTMRKIKNDNVIETLRNDNI